MMVTNGSQRAGRAAGFVRRAMAYFVDVLPVTLVVAALFYWFGGFDRTVRVYVQNSSDEGARRALVRQRNMIRDTALLAYLMYATLLEGSSLQGTVGKYWLGIKVVGPSGRRIGLARSALRNLCKIASYLPLGLGFFWILVSPTKRSWHDHLARTWVVRRSNGEEVK